MFGVKWTAARWSCQRVECVLNEAIPFFSRLRVQKSCNTLSSVSTVPPRQQHRIRETPSLIKR